jgi:hypothetical protein
VPLFSSFNNIVHVELLLFFMFKLMFKRQVRFFES